MICAPPIGCSRSSFSSSASAGGQLEHPSDVNSSSSTGWRGTVLSAGAAPPFPLSTRVVTATPSQTKFVRIDFPSLVWEAALRLLRYHLIISLQEPAPE